MNISLKIKPLFILIIGFILFTVIGTLSHEYGHIIVANSLGYNTKLHYGSMNYMPKGYLEDPDAIALRDLTKDYLDITYDLWPKNIKDRTKEYNNILEKRYKSEKSNNDLLVSIGGPLQTVLTGTIGLLILIWRRKYIFKNGMEILDWIAIFLSLFWLREIFNLVTSVGGELISPDGSWFGGDESYISQGLDLWSGTIPILLATIGFAIGIYVVFKILPKKIRLTFILGGFIGGITGFILWMNIIGPKILP